MDGFVNTYLCGLLRRVICQDNVSESRALTAKEFDDLLKQARRHEVQAMTAYGLLLTGGLTQEQEQHCRKLIYQTMIYWERMNLELRRTCELLENAGIDYMPLKGAVIRDLYPEPWMRTSGDIDILVKDADRAAKVLVENGYTYKNEGSHDISIISPMGITVELHFQLIETDLYVNAVLEQIWEHAIPRQRSCCYDMEPELFYFYHIAHMAKHMVNGGCGCGIRFFIDIYLILRNITVDKELVKQLLHKGGLARFAEQVESLSRVWFGNGQPESLDLALESFILDGGVFGSKENLIKINRIRAGTPIRFLLLRIFWPYDQMVLQYAMLKKYPILLPVFWVRRLITLLLKNRKFQGAVQELEMNKKIDKNAVSATKRLFMELELL